MVETPYATYAHTDCDLLLVRVFGRCAYEVEGIVMHTQSTEVPAVAYLQRESCCVYSFNYTWFFPLNFDISSASTVSSSSERREGQQSRGSNARARTLALIGGLGPGQSHSNCRTKLFSKLIGGADWGTQNLPTRNFNTSRN